MFQGLIRKTTSGEFKAFFQRLAEFMTNALQPHDKHSPTTPIRKDSAEERKPVNPQSPRKFWMVPPPQYVMFGVVLAVQLFMLRELQDMKRSIRSLNKRD